MKVNETFSIITHPHINKKIRAQYGISNPQSPSMKIQHPFQCIEATRVCTPDGECHSVLLAASGPTIRCFDIQSGKLCSSWGSGVETAQENAHDIADNDGEPPGKKLRLSEPEDDGNATVSKKGKKNGDQAKAEGAAVIILQVIPGSQRFVAVTGEDKAVRVFELDGHGTIKPLSIRLVLTRLTDRTAI